MPKPQTFHGWTIADGQRPDGKPTVTLTKPDRNTITTIGRVGTEREILHQRAKVYALEQDVEQSTPDERIAAKKRLREATLERDIAHAQRVAAAAVMAAAEQNESEAE